LNCINDLLLTEEEKIDFIDHIKSQPVSSLKEAVEVFHVALKKRKVLLFNFRIFQEILQWQI